MVEQTGELRRAARAALEEAISRIIVYKGHMMAQTAAMQEFEIKEQTSKSRDEKMVA